MRAGHPRSAMSSLALLGLAVLLLSACEWPTFRYDAAHTGFNSTETVIGTKNVAQLRQVWSADTGAGPIFQHSSPSAVNGVVYMGGDDGQLYALNANTGAQLWRGVEDDRDFRGVDLSSPAVADGMVFSGTGSENISLRAWDAAGSQRCSGAPKTCKPLWTFVADGNLDSAPVVVGGVLYVASRQGGFLYAIDDKTGTLLWKAFISVGTSSSPAVSGGVVYVGSRDDRLWAFDAGGSNGCGGVPKTCSPLWTATTGSWINSSPAIANGVVYVGSVDHKLYAFDAAGQTGCSGVPKACGPLWTATTGAAVDSSPAIANGVVYVGSDDDKLYAFDAAGQTGCTGSPKACTPLWTATTPREIESSPAVANGVVFVASDNLYAYDAAGTSGCSGAPKKCAPLLTAGLTPFSASSPTVANGRVYIGGSDFAVHAYALP